jgi:hypothetical protein
MDLSVKLSEIEFSPFLGQKVTEVILVGKELINLKFENGNVNVECSWRLRNQNGLIIGYSEKSGIDLLSILKKNLLEISITNIYHFEPTEDMIIEFDNKLFLDVFVDSASFEQYQLYQGEKLFLIGK